MRTHNKIIISMLGAFLTIAIITSIIPYVYTPVFVIRHISYFLTAATIFLFFIYNIYVKLKKTYQKPHHIRWINLWTLLSVLGAFTAITIAQNSYIDNERLIAFYCTYYDMYGNEIHRNDFRASCESPRVYEQNEQYLLMSFAAKKEAKTPIVYTEEGRIFGDQYEAFDVTHIVTTRIEITYDQDHRILVFTKDIIDNYNVIYENAYYYMYRHQKQVIENTYDTDHFTSIQSIYESLPHYEVNDEIQAKSSHTEIEDMSLVQKMTYELSMTQTAENLFEFRLDLYHEKYYTEDIEHSWLFGHWYYTEEGYRADYKQFKMGELYPFELYTYTLIKQKDQLNYAYQIGDFIEFNYRAKFMDGKYIMDKRDVVSESYPSELTYRAIQQKTHTDIFTQAPNRMYYRFYEADYGGYLQRLGKKRYAVSNIPHYFTRPQQTSFNYLDIIGPSQLETMINPHPLIDYIEALAS